MKKNGKFSAECSNPQSVSLLRLLFLLYLWVTDEFVYINYVAVRQFEW